MRAPAAGYILLRSEWDVVDCYKNVIYRYTYIHRVQALLLLTAGFMKLLHLPRLYVQFNFLPSRWKSRDSYMQFGNSFTPHRSLSLSLCSLHSIYNALACIHVIWVLYGSQRVRCTKRTDFLTQTGGVSVRFFRISKPVIHIRNIEREINADRIDLTSN